MVDTKAVSVRLPLDLLNELNSYATDKGMVRGGDANIGGAIIAILREHFGQSDSVKQLSYSPAPDVDIESMINDAIAPLVVRLEALETNRSEATAPANFTQALLQRVKEVAPLMLQKSA